MSHNQTHMAVRERTAAILSYWSRNVKYLDEKNHHIPEEIQLLTDKYSYYTKHLFKFDTRMFNNPTDYDKVLSLKNHSRIVSVEKGVYKTIKLKPSFKRIADIEDTSVSEYHIVFRKLGYDIPFCFSLVENSFKPIQNKLPETMTPVIFVISMHFKWMYFYQKNCKNKFYSDTLCDYYDHKTGKIKQIMPHGHILENLFSWGVDWNTPKFITDYIRFIINMKKKYIIIQNEHTKDYLKIGGIESLDDCSLAVTLCGNAVEITEQYAI